METTFRAISRAREQLAAAVHHFAPHAKMHGYRISRKDSVLIASRAVRLAAVAGCLILAAADSAHASTAASVNSILASAEHDTNTVHTLIHHDVITEKTASVSVVAKITGEEDEVRNREQDTEVVTATGKQSNGKTKTIHYTLEVIFMNGTTYYRTTLDKNKWQKHSGMKIADPYSGVDFARARTTVKFGSNVHFAPVSGSKYHFRAQTTSKNVASTIQLWVTSGHTPYVQRELEVYHRTKGTALSGSQATTFGPFNKTLVILPPISGSSA